MGASSYGFDKSHNVGWAVWRSQLLYYVRSTSSGEISALATSGWLRELSFAASVLFISQLWFELRGSTEVDHITVEYTVDRQLPGLFQFGAAHAQLFKRAAESMASHWLAAHNPAEFTETRAQLDMAIASMFYYA